MTAAGPDAANDVAPTTASVNTTDQVAALGTTLLVWAHPDDEAYLAGGLMVALRAAGQRVVCVTATRGEVGDGSGTAEQRRELARVRQEEAAAALRLMNVEEHHWLGFADGKCANADLETAVSAITGLMTDVRPDTVVSFGSDGFTGHPDHIAVATWVEHAVSRAGVGRPRLLQAAITEDDWAAERDIGERFDVYALGEPRVCRPEEVALRLELTGAELDRKVAALQAHTSQTAGLIEALGLDRYTAWVRVEAFVEWRPSGAADGE